MTGVDAKPLDLQIERGLFLVTLKAGLSAAGQTSGLPIKNVALLCPYFEEVGALQEVTWFPSPLATFIALPRSPIRTRSEWQCVVSCTDYLQTQLS